MGLVLDDHREQQFVLLVAAVLPTNSLIVIL